MNKFDNTFNLTRFKNLCRLIIADHWKRDMLGALLLFILSTSIAYLIFRFSGRTVENLSEGAELLNRTNYVLTSTQANSIFSLFLALIGGIYIISFVKELSPKHPRTSIYLMLPVSAFERLLSVFLFAGLTYTIITTLLLTLGINIGIYLASLEFENFNFSFIPLFKGYYFTLIGTIVMSQQACLVGTFYFRKNILIKTWLFSILITALYQLISRLVLALFVSISIPLDYSFWEILLHKFRHTTTPIEGYEESILHSKIYIIPILFILFWTFAFYKIKEKELK